MQRMFAFSLVANELKFAHLALTRIKEGLNWVVAFTIIGFKFWLFYGYQLRFLGTVDKKVTN